MKAKHYGLVPGHHGKGIIPERYTLEWLCKPEVMTEILYKTQKLTEDAYNDLVDDIGYRAARLVIRAKALSGDVKALDLYDKIVTRDRDARKKRDIPTTKQVHATPFIQANRETESQEESLQVNSPEPITKTK